MALKKYDTNIKAKLPDDESIASGVSCSERLCAECDVKHTAKDEPYDREELREWQRVHNNRTVACPGEMMIVVPKQKSNNLFRAVCAECGWRGWV